MDDPFAKLEGLTLQFRNMFPVVSDVIARDYILRHEMNLQAAIDEYLENDSKKTNQTSPAKAPIEPPKPQNNEDVVVDLLGLDSITSSPPPPRPSTNVMDIFGNDFFANVNPNPSPSPPPLNLDKINWANAAPQKKDSNPSSPKLRTGWASFGVFNLNVPAAFVPQTNYSPKEIEAAQKLQSFYRRKKWQRTVEKLLFLARRRMDILGEILSTEKRYVTCLGEAINVFISPIISGKILSEEEIKSLFSNLKQIGDFHALFLGMFSSRLRNITASTKIADIFLELIPYLKMYKEYVNNFNTTIQTHLMESNKKFAKFVNKCHSKTNASSGSSYLAQLLISPIQRIPRYELLLFEILKHTPNFHEDYEGIKECLQQVKEVAEYLNEKRGKKKPLKEHQWEVTQFSSPKWCIVCSQFIWGIIKQGYECRVCGETIHKHCMRVAIGESNCSGKKVRSPRSPREKKKGKKGKGKKKSIEGGERPKRKKKEGDKKETMRSERRQSVLKIFDKRSTLDKKKKGLEKAKTKEEKEKEKTLKKRLAALKDNPTAAPVGNGEDEEELSNETETSVQWIQKMKKSPTSRMFTVINNTKMTILERDKIHEGRGKWRRKPPNMVHPHQPIQFGVEGKHGTQGYCYFTIEEEDVKIGIKWGYNKKGEPNAKAIVPSTVTIFDVKCSGRYTDAFCDIKLEILDKEKKEEALKPTDGTAKDNSGEVVFSFVPPDLQPKEEETKVESETKEEFNGFKMSVFDSTTANGDSSSDSDSEDDNRTRKLFRNITFIEKSQVKEADSQALAAAASALKTLGGPPPPARSRRPTNRGSTSIAPPKENPTKSPEDNPPSATEPSSADDSEKKPTIDRPKSDTEDESDFDDSSLHRPTESENESATDMDIPTESEASEMITETDLSEPNTSDDEGTDTSSYRISPQEVFEKSNNLIRGAFTKLERALFMESLNDINEIFRLFGHLSDPTVKSREAKICRNYKSALRILITKTHESDKKKGALWTRFLAEIPIQAKHRVICVRMAIKSNMEVGNFGVAARFLEMILKLNLVDKQNQLTQLEICKQNGLVDKGLVPFVCPSCNSNTSPGNVKCSTCGAPVLLCNQSLELIVARKYFQCDYCEAILSKDFNQRNECSFCRIGKLVAKEVG